MKKHYTDWLLKEHYNRVNKFIENPEIFYAPGSYSDPNECPIKNVDVIQIGIPNTRPYNRDWCYYHVGFMTGIYHALLNKKWDVLIHVQDRTLLGENLLPIITEFMNRPEILCAPKYSSQIGTFIETGLMMLKPQAAKIYATQHLRVSLSSTAQLNVEEEAYQLFEDNWWNAWPEISTIRQLDVIPEKSSAFKLSEKTFLNLPFIAAGKHSDKDLTNKWIDLH